MEIRDVIAKKTSEKTGKDGKPIVNWVKCGVAFLHDDDRISVKLDAVPVGPGWDGYLTLKKKDAQDGQRQPAREERQPTTHEAPAAPAGNGEEVTF